VKEAVITMGSIGHCRRATLLFLAAWVGVAAGVEGAAGQQEVVELGETMSPSKVVENMESGLTKKVWMEEPMMGKRHPPDPNISRPLRGEALAPC